MQSSNIISAKRATVVIYCFQFAKDNVVLLPIISEIISFCLSYKKDLSFSWKMAQSFFWRQQRKKLLAEI